MTIEEAQAWGKLIKYHRKQLKLKQEDLAVGLCTASYLSRIENGIVIAEQGLYESLLAELGIDLTREINNRALNHTFLERMYVKLLSNEIIHKEEIITLENLQKEDLIEEQDIIAALIYSRYLLAIKENSKGQELLTKLQSLIVLKDNRITEIYIGVSTFSKLSHLQFQEILENQNKHQLHRFFHKMHSFELANYVYHLAFAAHRNFEFNLALQYINKTNTIFNHQYKPLFQLKIYSLKGVILNDLYLFDDAHIEFDAGIDLLSNVEFTNQNFHWSSLLNNKAYCFECAGQFKEASEVYERAYQYEADQLSIINWMRTCNQLGDTKKLKTLLNNYPTDYFLAGHQQDQRQLLDYISKENYSVEGLKQLEQKIFPYFEKQSHFSLLLYYAPLWASYYEAFNAYKQVSNCLKIALSASEELRARMAR